VTEVDFIEIGDGIAVVVYDARTGAVRHVHEEITLEGGRTSTPEDLVKNALGLASSFGRKDSNLATLVLSGEELREAGRIRVDVNAKRLIHEPQPTHVKPSD